MRKMGYGSQPYIVFLHEDIERRHIHIVSTCVNERGEKIDDSYEWNRSMRACRELERKFGLQQVADKRRELLEPYLKKADYRDGDVKRQIGNILKERVFIIPIPVVRRNTARCCHASTSRRNR